MVQMHEGEWGDRHERTERVNADEADVTSVDDSHCRRYR
jgi:hypothetical protein